MKALPEADLRIDHNRLDDECMDQPRRMRIWARIYADAKKATRDAKDAREVIRATIRSEIRANPQVYGFTAKAPNVDAVDDITTLDPRFQAAQKRYSQCQYEEEAYEGYVLALKSRDYNISNLTKLHGQGYFIAGSQAATPQAREAYKQFQRAQVDNDAAAKAAELDADIPY